MELEKLKRSLEELDEILAEVKAERVAKGLPADPPDDFLPIPISAIIAEKVLEASEFITKYTKLVFESEQLLQVNVDHLQETKDLADLLSRSKGQKLGVIGAAMKGAINIIEKINAGTYDKSASKAAGSLYIMLKLAHVSRPDLNDAWDYRSSVTHYEQVKPYREEYDRLKGDEALYKAELSKYQEHYASIKHLY